MKSNNETSHANNVANFGQLLSDCTGFNNMYQPTLSRISISSLESVNAAASNAMKEMSVAENAFNKVQNEREDVFSPLKQLCTRITNSFAVCGAPAGSVTDLKAANKKVQGGSSKSAAAKAKKLSEETPDAKTRSQSQQGYDNLLANFSMMYEILKDETLYNPNENDLKTETIQSLIEQMDLKNKAVQKANTNLDIARIARDKVLYAPQTGMYDISQETKKYVKSVFGAKSPEFKKVSGIKLKNLMNK